MAAERRHWVETILDFFFPPRCAGCRKMGEWLCSSCYASIRRLQEPTCRICGQEMAVHQESLCLHSTSPVARIIAAAYYEGTLREAILKFKYLRAKPMAQPLAGLMVERLKTVFPQVDCVVPVPLHPNRQAERGFNQSELLAERIAEHVRRPVVTGCIVRVKDTLPQSNLDWSERQANVADAFACRDAALGGQRVLLIDDICTTGATLAACARVLKTSGVKRVTGLVVARTVA